MVESVSIECRDVSFAYRRRVILESVGFQVGPGITGLLGPNGAGKSTLLGLLATVSSPRSGEVLVRGLPTTGDRRSEIRRSIGFLPQRFDLMRGATVRRNVAYAAWCNGVDPEDCDTAAVRALEIVDLVAKLDDRVSTLSGGQRQRVGIACAVAHEPSIVLLDEPTVGLDPAQRIQIRHHLSALAETATILLSTHIVEDLAQIATGVIVLADGRVLMEGSVSDLEALGRQSSDGRGVSPIEAGYIHLLETPQRSAA